MAALAAYCGYLLMGLASLSGTRMGSLCCDAEVYELKVASGPGSESGESGKLLLLAVTVLSVAYLWGWRLFWTQGVNP